MLVVGGTVRSSGLRVLLCKWGEGGGAGQEVRGGADWCRRWAALCAAAASGSYGTQGMKKAVRCCGVGWSGQVPMESRILFTMHRAGTLRHTHATLKSCFLYIRLALKRDC